LVELVVFADTGKGDPVVDLPDLVQGSRGVLSHDEDPVGVHAADEGPAPSDVLPGVVGPVPHQLFRRDVEGHAHRPPGPLARRCSISRAKPSATWSSATRSNPLAVIVATVG